MDLSIIIPVYNVEEYLQECLDSIYKIKEINKEVIIINDGSTDSSQTIIDKYLEKYPLDTKVIIQENQGLSGARNSGLNVAEGEYVTFIDSDDFIIPQKYVELFNLGVNCNLDIIVGGFKYKFKDNIYTTKSIETRKNKLIPLGITTGLDFF
ncbi:glycosyltransferase [Cohnella rhizosphaerae]|uniref:Glycosyltransferase n=1 Tax=Cohnella rhizosphaerae TaxID=1457232 RepID=A0A9X4KVU1_9BACL|nr:glycosyltransferase [Cohnella rhizosphaerae]MDG0811835.1 glycosyltransferase [Cohnella rhizosphaerae]